MPALQRERFWQMILKLLFLTPCAIEGPGNMGYQNLTLGLSLNFRIYG
jgi:hypothetical protein